MGCSGRGVVIIVEERAVVRHKIGRIDCVATDEIDVVSVGVVVVVVKSDFSHRSETDRFVVSYSQMKYKYLWQSDPLFKIILQDVN